MEITHLLKYKRLNLMTLEVTVKSPDVCRRWKQRGLGSFQYRLTQMGGQ